MRGSALGLLWDAAWALRGGPTALRRRQRERLADMVRFARARSPYYREQYRGLPDQVEDPARLPVTDKKQLMARFDDWVTDPGVTLERAREFVGSPGRVGEWFLGRHTLATTSGTTGTPGLFVLDAWSFAVAGAMGFRMLRSWLGFGDLLRIARGGGRLAMVSATGGHYASAVAAARLGRRRGKVLALALERPLPELAARLEEFQPAVLAPYASAAALLAGEQEAGRLHLRPVLVVLSAEGLPLPEYERIARAFGARVRHSYAATECPFLSSSCREGWLHVNSDWAILEPVDREHRPVPPGETSETVLLTNLANRVQPILRYDLGDRVLARPDPCPCGSPLPAIRVRGGPRTCSP